MTRTTPTTPRLLTRLAAPMVLAGLLATACSDDKGTTPTVLPVTRVVVTSVAGDTASELFAAIYSRVLQDAGFSVTRRDPVQMDEAARYQAVQDGTIQLIPDWTGDLLHFVYSQPGAGTAPTTVVPSEPATTQAPITIVTTTIPATSTTTADTTADTAAADTTTSTETTAVSETTTAATDTTASTETTAAPETTEAVTTTTEAPVSNGRSALEQLVAIKAQLPDTVLVSNGVPAEKNTVVACTQAAMQANAGTQLKTLTDLASIAPSIRLGASTAWQSDEVAGLPAFTQFYGGELADVVTVDDAGLADAITNKTVDCLAIDSLNPLITTQNLTILTDDRTMIPGNAAIALLSAEIATPDLVAALDTLSASLTTERLNSMLNEINANGSSVADVANAFVDSL